MTLDPKDLHREIEATLAELEEIEADVMEFFADLGPQVADRIAAYKAARAREPNLEKLGSVRPRETEDVLGDVGEDELLTDRRDPR